MAEASSAAAPLLKIKWCVPPDADVGAQVSLQRALSDLKRTHAEMLASPAAGQGVAAWANELLQQAATDVVCWAQRDEAQSAWAFHVVAKNEPSALLATSVTRALWPISQTQADNKALQAVLQILVLLPAVQPGCSKGLLELLLDILLRAEAWTLEPAHTLGDHSGVVLSTMAGAAWLAMYRAAKQDVYVQRALDMVGASAQAVQAEVPLVAQVGLTRVHAEALMVRGLRLQDAQILQDAVALFERAAGLQASISQDEDWAMLLVMQGHALESLAQMRRDESNWSRAADVYRAALTVLSQAVHGTRWAAVKTNLGRVLSAWGRQKRDAEVLYEAVRVLDEALLVYTPGNHASAWANGMHYSGVVLQALGQLQRDSVQLVLALQAFEKALQQRPRDTQPTAWATTKHHLASLLTQLGLEQNDSAKLRQAVAGFQEALEVRTLSSSPQDWVATQHAMGRAYDALGRREQGVRAFEQAIEAYTLALSQRTRALAPVDWAVLQFDLGHAWLQVGYRLQQVAALQSAASAYRDALRVFDPTVQSVQWTQASHSMAAALRRVGELGGHADALEQAAQTYESVLSTKAAELSPHDLATVLDGLLACQTKRAAMRDDATLLRSAIDRLQHHLPLLDEKGVPAAQAVRKLMAQAWLSVALDHGDNDALPQAIEVAQTWLNNTGEASGSPAWLQVQVLLASAKTAQALVEPPAPEALAQARQHNRAVLDHADRQSHASEWALATGQEALCEWVASIAAQQPEPAAALAVLTQVMAILWRADPQAATRMERAHAQVQWLARQASSRGA